MTFHSHQDEIDKLVSDLKAEKRAPLDFPVVRSMETCPIPGCRQHKGRGLLLCWSCIGFLESDAMTVDHALELIAEAEAKNAPERESYESW